MKVYKNLLAIYGLIVAIVLPVLLIISDFLDHPLISTRAYYFAVATFLLLVYTSKTKHRSPGEAKNDNNNR